MTCNHVQERFINILYKPGTIFSLQVNVYYQNKRSDFFKYLINITTKAVSDTY